MARKQQLGEKIRELRRRLKMTQSDLAGNDFTKSFISQVEKGYTRPSIASLQIIARRLNQPISYFLEDDELSSPSQPDLASSLTLARTYHSVKRYREALLAYERALGLCSPTDFGTKGEIHFKIGHVYYSQGQYSAAVDQFSLAIDELERSNQSELYVRAVSDLGSAYYQLGKYSQSLEMLSRAFKEYQALGTVNIHVGLVIASNLGNVLARLGEHKQAISVLKEALDTTISEGGYFNYGKLCHALGYSLDAIGSHEEAIEYSSKAAKFYEAVGEQTLKLSARVNLIRHLRNAGRVTEAEELASECLAEAQTLNAPGQFSRTNQELAEIALEKSDLVSATKYIGDALKIDQSHPDAPDWAEIVVAIAKKATIPPEIVARLEYHVKNWSLDNQALAELHSHLGELYTLLGDPQKANEHLSKSVALYRAEKGGNR